MSKMIDLTGQKIGRLTVLCREGTYQRPSGNKEPTWRCKCECGNEVVVLSSNLKKKNTLSCGCLQTENRKVPRRETEYEIRGDVAYVKSFDGVEFIINTCDLDAVISHRWHRNGHGYIADEHGNTIHRFLMKSPAVMDVHHINENKLDNRRINLLMMSRSEHTASHQRKDVANGVTLSNLETVNKEWIPVTERLPESQNPVLVVAVSKGMGLPYIFKAAHINHNEITEDEYGWTDGEYDSEYDEENDCFWIPECWYECNAVEGNTNWIMDDDYTITHWMPLPQPPKGE